MSFPHSDTLLLPTHLQSSLYSQLVLLLNENDSWVKLASIFGIFSESSIQKIKRAPSPAEVFLSELGARLCSVGTLCEVLRRCELYHILMLLKEPEVATILEEPCGTSDDNTYLVARGKQLKLTCKATGLPPPTYQWYRDNEELEDETSPCLIVKNFKIEYEGGYYCLIDQGELGSTSSCIVTALLMPEPPIVLKEPKANEVCLVNSKVTLSVLAIGHPKLSYQWYKENKQLDGSTDPQLTMRVKGKSQEGNYRCYIYNSAGEAWSKTGRITIFVPPEGPMPSAKLALLIANQLYDNLNHLYAPENDVKTLADLLQDFGFSVIALQNLNLKELRNAIQAFSQILPENAYVVFYFAGHGFETQGKFMLPVDVPSPESYLQADAVSERELLQNILSRNPMLVLELLDMCLKPPDPINKKILLESPQIYSYKPNINLTIIQGYATTSYLGAYENKSEANGLYVKHLKKNLMEGRDLPIMKILDNVNRAMQQDYPNQKPFFGHNAAKDYKLTDFCEDNPAIRSKMESLSIVPKETILNFEKCGFESKVTCYPYLGVYLNTMDVFFTNIQDYRVGYESFGEFTGEFKRFGEIVKLEIRNLQKLTSPGTLTLSLYKDEELIDCAEWCLGKPLCFGFTTDECANQDTCNG